MYYKLTSNYYVGQKSLVIFFSTVQLRFRCRVLANLGLGF